MLSLTTKIGQQIDFVDENGEHIGEITVVGIKGNAAKLGFSFDTAIRISRRGLNCHCTICKGAHSHDEGGDE